MSMNIPLHDQQMQQVPILLTRITSDLAQIDSSHEASYLEGNRKTPTDVKGIIHDADTMPGDDVNDHIFTCSTDETMVNYTNQNDTEIILFKSDNSAPSLITSPKHDNTM